MQKPHFSEELNVVKMLEIEVPTPLRLARIASAMPAMTNPYSMAVAPERSSKRRAGNRFKSAPPGSGRTTPAFDCQPGPES